MEAKMALSKSSIQDLDVPVLSGMSWPSWRWLDEMFHDADWRQMIKIEECTEGDSMVVRAELPGVDPDKDIQVEIVNDALVITAEKAESHEKSTGHVHRSEFRYGSLTRSVPIPKGVDESTIHATYKDGVLEIRMALPSGLAKEATRKVEIQRG
jgi:HSP20 family protein